LQLAQAASLPAAVRLSPTGSGSPVINNTPQELKMAAQQQPQQQQIQAAEGHGWYVEVTDQPLDLLRLTQLVTQPEAGAISTFIGTTRNNFNNKAVLYLEYEAYIPMAVAKLKVR
jgi:hypothetical protein